MFLLCGVVVVVTVVVASPCVRLALPRAYLLCGADIGAYIGAVHAGDIDAEVVKRIVLPLYPDVADDGVVAAC